MRQDKPPGIANTLPCRRRYLFGEDPSAERFQSKGEATLRAADEAVHRRRVLPSPCFPVAAKCARCMRYTTLTDSRSRLEARAEQLVSSQQDLRQKGGGFTAHIASLGLSVSTGACTDGARRDAGVAHLLGDAVEGLGEALQVHDLHHPDASRTVDGLYHCASSAPHHQSSIRPLPPRRSSVQDPRRNLVFPKLLPSIIPLWRCVGITGASFDCRL